MRALFFSLPLHGHTNPSLPLVRELIAHGDEVIYYSNAHLAERIEQAGAQYRPYRQSGLADLKGLPERMEQITVLLMQATLESLDRQLAEWRDARPDYLIADSVAPWGHWAAKLLALPLVTSVPTLALNRRVLSYGIARGVRPRSASLFFAKLRCLVQASKIRGLVKRRYRVDGPGVIGSLCGRSQLNIVYTSRYFQPCAGSFDETFQFVGPSAADRRETVPFPWERVGEGKLVYISMGTLFNSDVAFYRACFDALRDEPCQVVLSTGANVAIESLGPPPANFIVQPYVPQLDVLARAGAFVSHGGMNSVNESLAHSVPLLTIPQMGEQHINGKRVEELGAGLLLPNAKATPERLRHAVRRLWAEPQFREGAARVRQSFESAGGAARAAQLIRDFTR